MVTIFLENINSQGGINSKIHDKVLRFIIEYTHSIQDACNNQSRI
jgi:hypothetical protein